MDAIDVRGLTMVFAQQTAVESLTLQVREGEVFGLVGPDGAGKSTVMRLLAGLMAPTSGEAWVDGCHTVQETDALRRHISYMPQRFGLYQDLTVMENIAFYADLFEVSKHDRQARIPELLSFSGMTPFAGRQARNLSGGMKQKLALACALIHTPRVLLLDEPTNGVDPLSRRDFWRILYKLLAQKVTIFVSTAYLDEAERCDRIGLMHKGRLILTGTPDEVKRNLRGVLIEVRCREPRRLLPLLAKQLTPVSAGLFGTKIHLLLTGGPEQAIGQVQRALAELDGLAEANLIAPSLEDVFISKVMSWEGGTSDA